MIETLHEELLATRSATRTLERWCAEHRLGGTDEVKIVARPIRCRDKRATAEQRRRLEVAATEEIRYRRVQLVCGTRVLSEACNWYVPSRLMADINQLLETSDTPFGKAVLGLRPYRKVVAANVVPWWMATLMPDCVLEHRAVVYARGGKPISVVHERYQREVLPDQAEPIPCPHLLAIPA